MHIQFLGLTLPASSQPPLIMVPGCMHVYKHQSGMQGDILLGVLRVYSKPTLVLVLLQVKL